MYNLRRTIRTFKTSKLGVFTAIGAVIVLTMLLTACPQDAPPGPTGPDSPANLVVEISGSQAVLTWDAVADAVEYRVYRADGPNESLVRIKHRCTHHRHRLYRHWSYKRHRLPLCGTRR